jgi:cytochrome subunit of sulfide dehydrogenase
MTRARRLLLAATLLASGAGAHAAGIRTASMLANTCAGCHGTHGASAGEFMPSISGMDKGYLYSVLSDYKSGLRPSTIMGRIMKGYTEQEIWAIAGFFADRPWTSANRPPKAKLVRAGQEIHDRLCESCHDGGGREQDDESPRLAGQWAGYTRYALILCRSLGERCRPAKMGTRVKGLSDAQIEALASFYESEK